MKTDILIIGGGDGGLATLRMIKTLKPETEITIVKPEKGFCFKCPLPFYIEGKAPAEGVLLKDEDMLKGANITYGKVTDASYNKHEVTLDTGDTITFNKAVIATGSTPYIPNIPKNNIKNISTLRSLEDANTIIEALKESKKVTIIGGGYIATELCEALANRGAQVTLIVRSRILKLSFDEELSSIIQKSLKENGINILTKRNISKIEGETQVTGIVLDNGEKLNANLIIFATSTKPALEPARKLGVAIGSIGVLVDDSMETSLKDIYAVGEVAEVRNLVNGKPTTAQTASSAMAQGAVAGYNITGKAVRYPGEASCLISKVFNHHIGRAGLTAEEAQKSGFKVIAKTVQYKDHYTSLPGGNKFVAKMVFDVNSGMFLGGQFIGEANVADKVEAATLALTFKAKLSDLIAYSSAAFPASTFNPKFNLFREVAQQVFKEITDNKH